MQANQPTTIADALASYGARTGDGAAPPYDAASLAAIYGARVQQLAELEARGYAWAEWRYDSERGENRWHGITTPTSAQRDENRLTHDDQCRMIQRLAAEVRAGLRDPEALDRAAANAIGCTRYDLRDSELHTVRVLVAEALARRPLDQEPTPCPTA